MTAAERAAGRFMRAPDHDSGTDGGDNGGDAGDADAGGDQGGADDNGGAGDADGKASDEGADGGDDESLMGKAGAAKDAEDGEGGDDDGDKADEPQLPEKYELTPPEGFEINDEILAELDPVLRDLKLDNDQANKLMPLAASFAKRIEQQYVDAAMAMRADLAKQAKADPDIGKGNWAETEALVAKALDQFGGGAGTPFMKKLQETGFDNDPEMIRMFRNIGRAISEDTSFVRSDAAASEKKSREEVLYPEDAPKKEVSA